MSGSTGQARRMTLDEDLREMILSDPDQVLSDPELMRALIAANERGIGENIVDLRGVAMKRLEGRLDRLEDTHRGVIAAAYENLAGTNIIHRAILQLLDPVTFEGFLTNLAGPVADTLRVDSLRLVLETRQSPEDPALTRLGAVLCVAEAGFVDTCLTGGRNVPVRPVVLRQVLASSARLHGEMASDIRSEAMMKLDFGAGRLPGMLVFGSEDPHQFRAAQGTDLLVFFSGVFERVMRRWLS